MTGDLTADEICRLLELERHATCGFVRLTFTSEQMIAPGGLAAPFADARPLGSALYFMVTRGAPVRLHRIRNDQLYHYQRCGGGAETVSFRPSMPMKTARIRTGFCPVLRPLCAWFIASARASPWR